MALYRLLTLGMLLSACASNPSVTPNPPISKPATMAQPNAGSSVDWVRTSAEHRALSLQTFRLAGERLSELARGLDRNTWAVILDADETVIDNSEYQKEHVEAHTAYSDSAWDVYIRREISQPMPGAVAFLHYVHELGGRVAIVTNRMDYNCEPTRSNFRKIDLEVDMVLCRPPAPAPGDKNPRFRAVAEGTAAPGMPPLRVLMWLGDNIMDFPSLTQDVRTQADSAFAHFGRDYFMLPNPMYGSWQFNPH